MSANVQTSFILIEKDNRVLLIQEGGVSCYGLWCLPGGHVDLGEDIEAAALREGREETGYELVNLKKLKTVVLDGVTYRGHAEDMDQAIDVHIFTAEVLSGDMAPDPQEKLLDIGWFEKGHAQNLPLRWEFLKELFS